MKKIQLLAIVIVAFASLAHAQDRMLSIDDIFDPQKRVPFSGRPAQIRGWSKDGLSYLQFVNGQTLKVNAQTGTTSPLYDTKKLVSVLTQTPGFTTNEANAIGQAPPQFNDDESAILINHNKDLWVYSIGTATVKKVTDTPRDEELEADFSPNGKYVSFVRGMNLFVVTLDNRRENQLTRDGSEKILNGYLDWVYEEELYGRGNKRGYWWSPDSTKIAFLRTDESPVPKFVLVDDTETNQRVENTDYPQAGDPNPLVTLGIADVSKTSLIPNLSRIPKVGEKIPRPIVRFGDIAKFVDLAAYDPKDFLISKVAWQPDSKAVVFQAQNREQTFLDLNAAAADGKITRLFRETSKAWVAVNGDPVWLKDGSFLWQSERDGFNHLYHFSKEGKLLKQLTTGRWEISSFEGVDDSNAFAYFTAIGIENDWLNTFVYRVRVSNGEIKRLTDVPGTHRALFNPSFSHFVDVRSDINTPPQTSLFRTDGTFEKSIDENKVPVLGAYKLGKPEFLKVRARDGFEMEAMRILPPDFDPNKKYPVLAYTYSGPHAPQVRNQWGGSRLMWHHMLAQMGYIIWVCDNRTGSGKGLESTWAVYKSMGQTETMDLDDGFSYLKSLPYVDRDRLGMWGWSYGGFMTSYFMTHTKTLKMGIAGGLVGDWALYDSIYTERYMRTPENNPDGYARTSVINAAKDLNGKLLIIHGTIDDNVHMQNSIKLIFELQKAGKQFEFMTYPTQRHGVSNPPQAKHMYQMMTDFVVKNL